MGSMLAVGLMSGTSLDGIDAALIETDGMGQIKPIAFRSDPYSDQARQILRETATLALSFDHPLPHDEIAVAEDMLTRRHIMAVRQLLSQAGVAASSVGVVGFHGQTIAHRPDRGWTWQIGDGAAMAQALGITVVNDLRSADVTAGGQGAPLLPVYHRALVTSLEKPLAVLNLGGVGNISWIGQKDELIAFDTGPGNALIDDWVAEQTGQRFDADGALALSGKIDEAVLAAMLEHGYFGKAPPKSLDRADFSLAPVRGLSTADGAATLTAFTAISVSYGLRLLPEPPKRLIVAGGGRHNAALMKMIAGATGMPVEPIEEHGWNGDATEAEGFAYMAVRALNAWPISFPGTTGVAEPMTGGRIHRP